MPSGPHPATILDRERVGSVRRVVSAVSRAGLAGLLFLLLLAALRLAPVYAEPPLDLRVLPLLGPAVLCAILAAITGRERRPRPVRPVVIGLLAVAGALAWVVAARPPAGLSAMVSGPQGPIVALPPTAIDLTGADLRELPGLRRWTVAWAGDLRAPSSGTYRIWLVGRGWIEVTIDGRPVLTAEGERAKAGAEVPLLAGPHALSVRLQRVGPGARLRLGWTRPRRDGRPDGIAETIPPRFLGAGRGALGWWLTDALALLAAALAAILVLVLPWDRPLRLPRLRPVTAGEIAFSLVGQAVLVAVMSWPLVLDLGHSGVMDRPDGRLNAWILAWDVHALVHHPARLFDAPIFHPLPDSLAFSENLLIPALLVAPALLWSGPVLGYNLALLGSFVISGLGAQLLVRRVSGDRLAAFVGGAIFAAGAHRWIRLAHLHAQVTLFLPLALLALDRFWAKRSWRRALLVGLLLALQGLSSVYLGAITALALAAAVACGIAGGLGRRDLGKLAVGLGLAGLLMAPAVWPYLRMRAFQGMEWTQAEVANYATTLTSYAAGGTRLWGPLTQRHLDPDLIRDTLFPGLTVLVLGLVGLARAPRRYRAVVVLASALAILFSLGPQTVFYRFLYQHLVLVRGIRALSRFSLIPVLGLAVLGGLALAGRFKTSLLALGLLLFESSNLPIRYARWEGPSPAARWLAEKPGAAAYLPLGDGDTEAMLQGVAHFRPLLNGDSGFVPRPYSRAMELLEGPLEGEALGFLRALGVRHLVTRDDRALPLAARFGEERIYEVPGGELATAAADLAERPVATLWTAEGASADLGQPAFVCCLSFELDDRPWLARPRVEVSEDGRQWSRVEGVASLAEATLALYRDPRHGRGEVCFAPQRARLVRLDPRLPAREGLLRARSTTP